MLTKQPELAEEWLEKANLAPARRSFRSIIYGSLGDVKQDLDQWEEASEAHEKAIRLDADNRNAMNNYAYCMSVRNERLHEALELVKRALQYAPHNTSYLDTIGWIHYKLRNYENALAYTQQAANNDNATPQVFD